jgi:prolyl 4-hydroxylase
MREHTINKLDNFIHGIYLDDTVLCNDLIEYHTNSETKRQGHVGGKVQLGYKRSTDCNLAPDSPLHRQYVTALQQVIERYIKKYPMAVEICPSWTFREHLQIQHYKPGEGFYAWHCERSGTIDPVCNRHLVWMTYLNDVTDDGGTEFFHQQVKVKPETGLTLIWPTDWTHAHRGITSQSQNKYIITGWLGFSV